MRQVPPPSVTRKRARKSRELTLSAEMHEGTVVVIVGVGGSSSNSRRVEGSRSSTSGGEGTVPDK